MSSLNFSDDEQLTRKEYLKNKKKQDKKLTKSKKKYIWLFIIFILAVYVFVQFYIYNRNNENKYLTDKVVEDQPVYDMFFLTEGYTYVPKTSLNHIKTNSLEERSVYRNVELQDIKSSDNNIYGIRDNSLYRLNKATHELKQIVEKDVKDYTIFNDEVYVIIGDELLLKVLNNENLELKDLGIKGAKQVVVDDSKIYVASSILNDNKLYSINKDGNDKKELTKKYNISYMIINNDMLYFVNKSDGNKIYKMKKNGENVEKVHDIETFSDKGKCEWIDGGKYMSVNGNNLAFIDVKDGNKLKIINLETKEISTEILSSVSEFKIIDDTIIYMIDKEKGVYLHNVKTKFSSQIVTKLVKEFLIER